MQSATALFTAQRLAGRYGAHPPAWMPVGGGSINDTYRLSFGPHRFFCKTNSAADFPQLFQKEKAGLDLLRATGALRLPQVVDAFEHEGEQLLLLEWIEPGPRTQVFWKRFGEGLARLHQHTAASFGLDYDNYMGSVPQANRQNGRWTDFFIEQRLRPLTRRCADHGYLSTTDLSVFDTLYTELSYIFPEAQAPSLLHGDLWSGNFLCTGAGEPVLIDPATYYGHPAVDLGLTTLFGPFDRSFYDAYQYYAPLPPAHREQWAICNLYPLLIHLLLFGSSYLASIRGILRPFIRK